MGRDQDFNPPREELAMKKYEKPTLRSLGTLGALTMGQGGSIADGQSNTPGRRQGESQGQGPGGQGPPGQR